MARSGSRPIWVSLAAMLALTAHYAWVVQASGSIPAAGEFYGHSLGVAGFVLMLMTETLYSLRKRSERFSSGRLSAWLEWHIITGLVGPFMVLLHSSWKFNGLAGVVLLLTGVVVLSGFVGRYIYTAMPRSDEGLLMEAEALGAQIGRARQELESGLNRLDERLQARVKALTGRPGKRLAWLRLWLSARPDARPVLSDLRRDAARLEELRRQHRLMASARRALALWHTVHLPLGLALFTTAFVHIGAALYYATLLR